MYYLNVNIPELIQARSHIWMKRSIQSILFIVPSKNSVQVDVWVLVSPSHMYLPASTSEYIESMPGLLDIFREHGALTNIYSNVQYSPDFVSVVLLLI